MKCRHCVAEGKTSEMWPSDSMEGAISLHFDVDGRLHAHYVPGFSPYRHKDFMRCDNNHSHALTEPVKCPVERCDWVEGALLKVEEDRRKYYEQNPPAKSWDGFHFINYKVG